MELLDRIKNNALVKNSTILFIGMMIFNVLNYLYHLIMSRFLTVQEFGELESVFALIYIISVPASALMILAMRYVSIYKAENNPDKAAAFFRKFHKNLLLVSPLIILFFIVLSPWISRFLNLASGSSIIILGFMVVFYLLACLIQGVLQGWQRFTGVSISLIIQGLAKFGFAILLVWLSLGVNGAIGGVFLGNIFFYLVLLYLLKFLLKHKEPVELAKRQIVNFFWPVFISSLAITFLYSLDMLLVKHFFSQEIAGNYGALTILSKVIFFATAPLIAVMFPMVAESHSLKGNYQRIMGQSLLLVCLVGLTPLVIYFLAPGLAISLLVGSKFMAIAPYLGWLSLATFMASLINFLANFFLSVHKTGFVYFIMAGVLILVILVYLFHQNLWQVVWIMNGVMAGILASLLGYFLKIKKSI
ncbi:MAG: oligosaccharide flippase family protein [bacterium]